MVILNTAEKLYDSFPLLEEMQNGIGILEKSIAVSHKTTHISTISFLGVYLREGKFTFIQNLVHECSYQLYSQWAKYWRTEYLSMTEWLNKLLV